MPAEISFISCRYRGKSVNKLNPFTQKVQKLDLAELTKAEWASIARVLNVTDEELEFLKMKLPDGGCADVGKHGIDSSEGITVRIVKHSPGLLRMLFDLLKAADWMMVDLERGSMIVAKEELVRAMSGSGDSSQALVCRTQAEMAKHLSESLDENSEVGGTSTPFDPSEGIWFKYGRCFADRESEIAAFERAIGFKLPLDFLDMIGEHSEGGFDGHYRVYSKGRLEVWWNHLLQMKIAKERKKFDYDAVRLLRKRQELFCDAQGLLFFPFGEAVAVTWPNRMAKGYLAFDVRGRNAVVFVPEEDGTRIKIAPTFREMMLKSHFAFYG